MQTSVRQVESQAGAAATRGSTTDPFDGYPRPMGAATPINPLAPMFDLLGETLDRSAEQSERAIRFVHEQHAGIVREQRAAEQRVLDEADQADDLEQRAARFVNFLREDDAAEQQAAEQRAVDEAHAPRTAEANDPSIGVGAPIGFADSRLRRVNAIPSVVIFDEAITLGLIATLAAEMELDGLRPCVRWHRNERGDIRGIEIARIVEEAA